MERDSGRSEVDPQELADLANTLADVVYIIRLEPDMAFEFVSDAVTGLVGYTPADHYADPGLGMRLVEPADLAVLAQASGHPLGEVFEYTVRWVARDGRRVWTHHRCVTTRREDGALILHGIARDVSALKEVESRFRLLAENAQDLVVLLGADRRPAWVSPSLRTLLGYTEPEFMALGGQHIVHDDDRGVVAEAVKTAERGEVATHEVRLRGRDGSFIWCELIVRRSAGDELIMTLRDRDAQVRAQHATLAEQERRRTVIETMHDPYALFEAKRDESGAVTDFAYIDVNSSACEFLGRQREQVLTTTMLTLFPGQVELGLFEAYVEALESGQAFARDGVEVGVAPNDTRYFDIRAVPLGGALLSLTWRDVSDRVASRRQLEEAEQRFRLLAENSSDVVALMNEDCMLTWISPSVLQTSGFSPEEFSGVPIVGYVHPDDLEQASALLVGDGDRRVVRLRHADGHYVWISAVSRAVASGEPRQYVIGLRDISAEQEALQRLTASQERLHNLLDAMLEPFLLLQAIRDDAGNVIDFEFAAANPAALAVYEMPLDELMGQRLSVLHPSAWTTDLFRRYVAVVDEGISISLDDWVSRQDMAGAAGQRYDVRAVRVGDAVSQTWRNVTERYENARRLAQSQEQFRLLAENASDVVLSLDSGRITWVSPSLERALGWAVASWTGRYLRDFLHPHDTVHLSIGDSVVSCRMRVLDVRGSFHWVHLGAKPLAPNGSPSMVQVASLQLIDDVMAFEAELQRRASYDDLTGALNRFEALDVLAQMSRYQRRPGDESAVLFCDIDGFKSVNDTFGHVVGDEVLKITARRIRGAIRGGDLLARMGGDEFLIVIDGLHALEEALAVAEKVRLAVGADISLDTGSIRVSLSVGVAMRRPGEDPDAVIARADQAMYEAKRAGRNRVVVGPEDCVDSQP